MALDPHRFQEQFEIFKERILRKTKVPFVSFRKGLAFEWEGYKEPMREQALVNLDVAAWQKADIGGGRILKSVIAAIEISPEGNLYRNNFVEWQDRWGHRSRSHYRLIDAKQEPLQRRRAEQWAYGFLHENMDAGQGFEDLRDIAGARYDLLAYMMFLRDSSRYMPVRVATFDKAFQQLGLDLRMSGNCTWENYTIYMDALAEIQGELAKQPGLADVGLVDAHSFCWLLVRPEMERPDKLFAESAKGKALNAKILDAVETSIFGMAYQAASTAASSNGQQVQVTKKNKDLMVTVHELRDHIRELLKRQDNKCALTGIPLQFKGTNDDPARLTSLDRIDSNGHYAPQNLQVVCRFVNQWKRNTPDAEFRRLLELVRSPAEAL